MCAKLRMFLFFVGKVVSCFHLFQVYYKKKNSCASIFMSYMIDSQTTSLYVFMGIYFRESKQILLLFVVFYVEKFYKGTG